MADDPGGFSLNPLVLLDRLKRSFSQFLSNTGSVLKLVLGAENITLDNVAQIESKFEGLTENFKALFEQIKAFKFEPKWKTRVILVPRAIEAGKHFWQLISMDFLDRLTAIAEPFGNFKVEIATLKEALSAQSVDSPTGVGRAVNQVENTVRSVNRLIGDVSDALDKIQDFEDLLQELTDDIEKLDEFFLPQGKPKQLVDVKYRKRIG